MTSSPQDPSSWGTSFPNQLPALMEAIDQLESFLNSHNAQPKTLFTARLAAEEMGTNILKYGYDDTNPHVIHLSAAASPDSFTLQLTDDGHAFDPTLRSDPSPDQDLADRTPGGWGISLVRKMSRSVTYERKEQTNILTITLDRQPAE
ncbi:MAG: ATP-binding protein [Limisphaerales bacterium]|jgi:serine/threonine-protein kinase RsbW